MNAVIIAILTAFIPVILAGAGWLILQLINTRAQVVILQEALKQSEESKQRQANDDATSKSVHDTVDNLDNASVHSMLEAEWGSPKQ